MKDAYAIVRDGEVWLHNLHIPPYQPAARDNHAPERDRKLLLHRREIERIVGQIEGEGLHARPDAASTSRTVARRSSSRWRAARTASTSASRSRTREMKRDMDRALRDAGR